MSYIALYRKWRPLVFDDVVEQEHVVKTLKNSVTANRIGHAYLFCGTRGTGKTTVARIFSRAINCLNPNDGDPCNVCEICKGILDGSLMDVIEIDAASNNSIEDIRDIRNEVVYSPTRAKFKVYIIDEVHMLSTGAFNGLLKTLEEPPAHAVFFLATTEPHKLPATILSRCQRFDFRRISIDSIIGRLDKILSGSGINIKRDAARLIAKLADGALRDAISILDQCIAVGNKEISYSDVLKVVGIVNESFTSEMVDALAKKNVVDVLTMVEKLVMEGKDIPKFISDMIQYYRNILVCISVDNPTNILDVPLDLLNILRQQSKNTNQNEIMLIIKELSQLEASIKWANNVRIIFEVALIRICKNDYSTMNENLEERIALLELKLSGNIVFPAPTQSIGIENEGIRHVNTSEVKQEGKADKQAKAKSSTDTEKPGVVGQKNSLKSIEKWTDVLNELKSFGRMALYTNLLDTKAVELNDRLLGIVFSKNTGFNKMLVSKVENLEVIASAVAKKLGREMQIKCIDEDSNELEAKYENKDKKDELVEKAISIARRLDIPVEVIDE